MNSKGQSLSISTMIIVALGLLVLVVLAILIFRSGSSADSSTSCVKLGGVCKTSCEAAYIVKDSAGTCGDDGGTCCSPVKVRSE